MANEAIIGIDFVGKPEKPTGWPVWENKKVKTNLIYTDEEIVDGTTRALIDPVTVASTACVHMRSRTEALGNDEEEDYIIVPKKQDWRTLRI